MPSAPIASAGCEGGTAGALPPAPSAHSPGVFQDQRSRGEPSAVRSGGRRAARRRRPRARVAGAEADAAGRERDQKRGPEAVVAQGRHQGERGDQVDQRRDQHHVAHVPAAGRADEDAVEHPGRGADERRGDHPGQVGARGSPHRLGGGHQIDDPAAAEREGSRQQRADAEAPEARHHRRAAQQHPVAPAQRLPHQRLGREGKAVHRVGGDHQELQQHLVGGQLDVAEGAAPAAES